jgi:hypothetical protein
MFALARAVQEADPSVVLMMMVVLAPSDRVLDWAGARREGCWSGMLVRSLQSCLRAS